MTVIGTQDLAPGVLSVTVDADPTSVAVDAPRGSLVIFKPGAGPAIYYTKDDDGSTTNVTKIAGVREFFEAVTSGSSGVGNTGNYPAVTLAAANFGYTAFRVPDDFGSLVAADLVIIVFGAGSNITVDVSFGADGESATTHTATVVVASPAGAGTKRELDISGAFGALAAGDSAGVRCNSDFLDFLLGVRLKYLPK